MPCDPSSFPGSCPEDCCPCTCTDYCCPTPCGGGCDHNCCTSPCCNNNCCTSPCCNNNCCVQPCCNDCCDSDLRGCCNSTSCSSHYCLTVVLGSGCFQTLELLGCDDGVHGPPSYNLLPPGKFCCDSPCGSGGCTAGQSCCANGNCINDCAAFKTYGAAHSCEFCPEPGWVCCDPVNCVVSCAGASFWAEQHGCSLCPQGSGCCASGSCITDCDSWHNYGLSHGCHVPTSEACSQCSGSLLCQQAQGQGCFSCDNCPGQCDAPSVCCDINCQSCDSGPGASCYALGYQVGFNAALAECG